MSTKVTHQEEGLLSRNGVSDDNSVIHQQHPGQGYQVSTYKTGTLMNQKLHCTSCSDTRTHACIDILTTNEKASVAEEEMIESMEAENGLGTLPQEDLQLKEEGKCPGTPIQEVKRGAFNLEECWFNDVESIGSQDSITYSSCSNSDITNIS